MALTGNQLSLTMSKAASHGGWEAGLKACTTCQSVDFQPATSRGGFSFGGYSAAMDAIDNDPESGSFHGKTEPPFTRRVSSELSERYRCSLPSNGVRQAEGE